MRRKSPLTAGVLSLPLMPAVLHAHPLSLDGAGFMHGLLHPLAGVDHLLAMAAMGMVAARLGGRSLWLLPAAFVSLMAAGGAWSYYGLPLPFLEAGIAVSVVLLGCLVAARALGPAAAALACGFAVFHGYAHGAELPVAASPAGYGAGFTATAAMLQIAGIGLSVGIRRHGATVARRIEQVGGAAVALAGVALLTRLLAV